MKALPLSDFGIAKFTPHDLRRTAATQMATLLGSNFIVGRILNHIDPTVTGRYDRSEYLDQKCEALQRWADKLGGIIGQGPA